MPLKLVLKLTCSILLLIPIGLWGQNTDKSSPCLFEFDSLLNRSFCVEKINTPHFNKSYGSFINYLNEILGKNDSINTSFNENIILDIYFDSSGNVMDVRIVKSNGESPNWSEMYLRKAILCSPKWEPGKCFNKNVYFKINFNMIICDE